MPLQIRRGTEAERQALASTPQTGELIYITDTKQLYVGDGTNLLRDLTPITGYTDENAADAIGSILNAGPHSGISFVYNDIADTIQATVSYPALLQNLNLNNFDITGTGNINIIGNLTVDGLLTADYKGSIYADDSTLLVNAVDGKIELDGTVKGNIIPDANEAYDIGSPSAKFKDLYLSGSSLYLGNAQLTATGSAFALPAGTTVGGNTIQTFNDASTLTDIQGSVFGDDSTLLVDAVSSKITGHLENSDYNYIGKMVVNQDLAEGGISITTEGSLDDDYDLFTIFSHHNDDISSGISFSRSRGTAAAPAALNANDEIFSWLFAGQGSDSLNHLTAQIVVSMDGALQVGGTVTPGKISFQTVNATGDAVEGLGIDSNQIITFSDNNELQAGSNPGEVDLTTSTTAASFLKVKVGGQEYALPLYLINP